MLFPDNAYRWDDTNDSWTDEEMNPTKPLNPFVYTNNFIGQSVASGLDQFIGAAGGTGYDLKASGFPWIQYVRVQPGAGTYTVIDAIAAVESGGRRRCAFHCAGQPRVGHHQFCFSKTG